MRIPRTRAPKHKSTESARGRKHVKHVSQFWPAFKYVHLHIHKNRFSEQLDLKNMIHQIFYTMVKLIQNHNEIFELLTVLQDNLKGFQNPPPKHTHTYTNTHTKIRTYTPSLCITIINLNCSISLSCLTVPFFINNHKNKQLPQKFSRKSISKQFHRQPGRKQS